MAAPDAYAIGNQGGSELVEGRTIKELEKSYAFFKTRFDDQVRLCSTSGMAAASGFMAAISNAIADRRAEQIWFPDPVSFVW